MIDRMCILRGPFFAADIFAQKDLRQSLCGIFDQSVQVFFVKFLNGIQYNKNYFVKNTPLQIVRCEKKYLVNKI